VHALEPLLYAFKPEQILMIHEPAVCLGALWVPYRRDSNVMRAVLRQGADTPGVSMIFCHADVRGAYMNDNMRSKEGLDIEAFPKNIPIYSGHFHKPHTVRTSTTVFPVPTVHPTPCFAVQIAKGGSTLRYVGSPYQTSLSEAGQDKFFYCVQRGVHEASNSSRRSNAIASPLEPEAETWKEVERWTVSIGSKIIKARIFL